MSDLTDLPEIVMPACRAQKLLSGQKALVTGASSGIGKAIAIALGEAGADVVVNFAGRKENGDIVLFEKPKFPLCTLRLRMGRD